MKTSKTNKSKSNKTDSKAPVASTAAKPAIVAAPAAITPRATTVTPPASKAPTAVAPAPRREITSDLIAARAYILWEQQGCPHGNDIQNWLQAERQLKQEIRSFTA